MSRQQPIGSNSASDSPTGQSSLGTSPTDPRAEGSEVPSSPSPHHRASESDSGYPSWLPKRPPPPAPTSTFQSSAHSEPFVGGRKPTPRSVRIINVQNSPQGERREPTDQTRGHARVWSRATGVGMSPTVFGSAAGLPYVPRPRFRTAALHPELLQSPSLRARIQFFLLPFVVFAHIPLQTFFDFNAVFILLQVAKFPNPEASGVPGSGRNWALGAAAYIACWATWIFVVFIVYEFVYSFYRRWRVKRPFVAPLYLSSSANNFVSMTSYTNFCFLRHIRRSAFSGETGSFRDGIAETFWLYSQNLPTVALLLPRAGLCLALLFAFSSPQPNYVALIDAGFSRRDDTFFRGDNGTLTNYARGVLIANAAWTAWRALVLLCSWIGLWIVSGQICAGFCGPRYRWEEEQAEKRASIYADNDSETDAIPWNWREGTQLRVQEAFDFCLTVRPSSRWGVTKKEVSGANQLPPVSHSPAFDGMEQVMAAVGFPSSPPPARRGVLSDNLFETPKDEIPPAELSAIIPKTARMTSRERDMAGPSGPLMSLPYPFSGYKAQRSSDDQVPFPPSPEHTESAVEEGEEVGEEYDAGAEEEEGEEEGEQAMAGSEEPSSQSQGRTSGSMSSLGQPVSSRYPFQFRHPVRGHSRGHSMSSAGASHLTPPSHSRSHSHSQSYSSPSVDSGSTNSRSSGQRSSDSPGSPGSSSVAPGSPLSASSFGSHIPMPPRHPQRTRGRARAGTVPSDLPSSPQPVIFPRAAGGSRVRTDSELEDTEAFETPQPELADNEEYSDEEAPIERPIPEGPHEAAEGEDHIGLLSAAPSPRTSFIGISHRPSNLSRRSRTSRSSGSSSRSRTGSAISGSRNGSSARSRAQSLIHSIGAASRSSLELVQTSARLRANSSMARLEEDLAYHSDGPSQPSSPSASNENHTFGHPMFAPPRRAEDRIEEVPRQSPSNISVVVTPSEQPTEGVATSNQQELAEATEQPISGGTSLVPSTSGGPVVDTATQEGTSAPTGSTDST